MVSVTDFKDPIYFPKPVLFVWILHFSDFGQKPKCVSLCSQADFQDVTVIARCVNIATTFYQCYFKKA